LSNKYTNIAARIRGELDDLDRAQAKAQRAWREAVGRPNEQDMFLDSVALNLHGFYSGLESLFDQIATHIDQEKPGSETWHRELLLQMTEDREDIRPAVIRNETATALDEFRRFRHVVRNVYAVNLLPDRIEGLLQALPPLWAQLRLELTAFAEFLEYLDGTQKEG
jgi:hypothetical protein